MVFREGAVVWTASARSLAPVPAHMQSDKRQNSISLALGGMGPNQGVRSNYGELSENVGRAFGTLTLFNTATSQSNWIAPAQRHNRSGNER